MELYNRFDQSTKEIAVNFLESTGLFKLETSLQSQPERFKAQDFYIRYLPTNLNLNVEVERKTVWIREKKWQYAPRGIHVPYRKKDSQSNLFIMLNRSGKSLLYTDMNIIKSSPVIEKDTINRITGTRTKTEKFFELSLDHPDVNFYSYNDGKWRYT